MNKRRTNILFFQNSILPAHGGVARVSDVVSKELIKRGYKCFFVYYEEDNAEYAPEMKLKIDPRYYKSFEKSVSEFVQRNRIEVFVCQYPQSNYSLKLFERIRKKYPAIPFISFLHASPDYWQKYKLKSEHLKSKSVGDTLKKLGKRIIFPFYNPYTKAISSLYKLSDKFVLLSESFKESFTQIYSVDNSETKLFAISNPLSFNKSISDAELEYKEKIVLIVSRLEDRQKKISIALKIWTELQLTHKDSHDWKLFIIGTGPDEGLYKNYVKANKVENVVFLGQKTGIIDYYLRASIHIITSLFEGLPMALLESQQNGVVPVVFDNFSAVYDVVNNEDNGFIINDNNAAQFLEKLHELMKDDAMRNKMAGNAIKASKKFNVKNITNEWESVLNA